MPVTIFIPLQGERTDVWRPVEAEHVGDDRYRILSQHQLSENWPFGARKAVRLPRIVDDPYEVVGRRFKRGMSADTPRLPGI